MATISGGKKLEAELVRLGRMVARPTTLRVGFLEGATYPSTPTKALRAIYSDRKSKGISGAVAGSVGTRMVAMIAAIQEFGAPRAKIPSRPFFRNMIAEKKGEWPKAIAGLLKANDYDPVKAMELAGFAIEGQLRESIIKTNSPPLSPRTIQRKGFAKPLVDTGHMLNSVDHEVNVG